MNPNREARRILKSLLDLLEPLIDVEHVAHVSALHRAVLHFQPIERLPLVCYLPYEGARYSPYPYPEAFADPAKMMVNELLTGFTSIFHAAVLKDDSPYTLRPNLGVGIVASLFGAQVRLTGNEMPWVAPLEGGGAAVKRAVFDAQPTEVDKGLLPRVLDQYAFFQEALTNYPKCKAGFQIILPDLEGPFSTLELLWGPGIYLAVADEPQLIRDLLARIAEVMAAVYRRLKGDVRDNIGPGCHYCHAVGVKGNYLLRNDSAINMSEKMYRDVLMHADTRFADLVGGVGVHFCGDGRHQVDNLLGIPGVESIDLGQPEKMDLDSLFRKASERRVPLLRLPLSPAGFDAERIMRRFPTGVILVHQAKTVQEGSEVFRRYAPQSANA